MFSKNKGFSLVELMITVSLIGILAAIGIPNYSKFRIRSFQSEAKSQLATLYTAEKSFYFQYNVYYSSLKAIGFAPMGRARYNIGFGAYGGTPLAEVPFSPTDTMSSKSICTGVGGVGTATSCEMINLTPNMPMTATATDAGFIASAVTYEDLMASRQDANSSPVVAFAEWMIQGAESFAQFTPGVIPPGTPKCTMLVGYSIDGWGITHDKAITNAKLTYSVRDTTFNQDECIMATSIIGL